MLSSRTNIFVGRIGKLKKGFVESGGGQKPDQPSNPHGVRTEVGQVVPSWHRLLRVYPSLKIFQFRFPQIYDPQFVSDVDTLAEDIYRDANVVKRPNN